MNPTISQHENLAKQIRALLSGNRNATNLSHVRVIAGILGHHMHAFPSQTYLGDKAGVTRESSNRCIKRLTDLILVKNYRYHQTCEYWFTSEFLNLRHYFYDLIPELYTIKLLLLFSVASNVFSRNVTLNKYTNYGIRRSQKMTSKWSIISLKNEGYGFYEPGYGSSSHIFIPSRQIAGNNFTSQRREVMESNIMQLLADAFNLNAEQAEQYNRYSKSVLLKALQSFVKQRKERAINNPQAWLARVAADEERKEMENASRFPKNGKAKDNSSVARNAKGNSPFYVSNMSVDERIEFLNKEIANFRKYIDNPQDYFHPNVDISSALEVGKARLKSCEDELAHIQRGGLPYPSFGAVNAFMEERDEASTYGSDDPDYESHLDEISRDKSDPEGYKLMVRRYDYRRTKRE